MNYAIILAGGTGNRIKSTAMPKQFLPVGGTPLLLLTVGKFLLCKKVDKIVVTAPRAWMEHTRDLLNEKAFAGVDVCQGGATRQESLYNTLQYIEKKYGTQDDDLAVSHDAARPFVSLRIIQENIDEGLKYGAVDTVVPSTDTIVASNDGLFISTIPQRSIMYQGQTPQSFLIKKFLKIYDSLDESYLSTMTDAARILQENGVPVRLIMGEPYNIKITTDYDLELANFILSGARV